MLSVLPDLVVSQAASPPPSGECVSLMQSGELRVTSLMLLWELGDLLHKRDSPCGNRLLDYWTRFQPRGVCPLCPAWTTRTSVPPEPIA
jgi:hypothetical protein